MLFNSVDFMAFFPIVLFVYYIIPKKTRYIWLLIASYYFYMGWNAKYALLIAISTIITYFSGILLELEKSKQNRTKRKNLIVAFSCISNLGILGFFKYFNFILDNINNVLSVCGIQVIDRPFDIVLPVGISFYTFQALSYTIDVYRGDIEAEKNFARYALFVSFFPQLVAGPIERSRNLLKQIQNIHNIKLCDLDRITRGIILMVYGYFLKMVIADRIAIAVNTVFDNYKMYGCVELIFAATGFAIQIYCDFQSYSLIAMGAARIMGLSLMENFNTPYFSRSIKEFWRRWHISLSSWLKDYVYIPLGGNRCSKSRKYFNIMITFFVSGIWHGANWTFIVWGIIHGMYQVIGEILSPIRKRAIELLKINTECFSFKLGQVFVTFVMTVFAWIFFRADTIKDAFMYISRIFTRTNIWNLFNASIYTLGLDRIEMNVLLLSLMVLLLVDLVRYKKQIMIDSFMLEQNLWFRWICLIGFIIFIVIFGEYGSAFDAQQFIYFQF